MSLRSWSTSYERRQLDGSIQTLCNLIIYFSSEDSDPIESDDDLSSLSSSSESSSGLEDSESDDEFDLIEMATESVLVWARRVNTQLQNERIHFGRRLTIADFGDSECISHFRFRKVDLQAMADQLWPRISTFLGPNRDKIALENRYHAPFETCLLIYLFKMSRPRRLLEDCESVFGMRKSHLSASILTFAKGLFLVAIKYLLDPRIWHGRMPYYARLISESTNGLMGNIWGFIDFGAQKMELHDYLALVD